MAVGSADPGLALIFARRGKLGGQLLRHRLLAVFLVTIVASRVIVILALLHLHQELQRLPQLAAFRRLLSPQPLARGAGVARHPVGQLGRIVTGDLLVQFQQLLQPGHLLVHERLEELDGRGRVGRPIGNLTPVAKVAEARIVRRLALLALLPEPLGPAWPITSQARKMAFSLGSLIASTGYLPKSRTRLNMSA